MEGFWYVFIAVSFIPCWFCNGGFATSLVLEIMVVLLNLEGKELFMAF
jgi:hypothetical protein